MKSEHDLKYIMDMALCCFKNIKEREVYIGPASLPADVLTGNLEQEMGPN